MSSQALSKITNKQTVVRKLYRNLYHYVTKLNQQEQMVQIQSLITTNKYYNTNNDSCNQFTSTVTTTTNPKFNLQQMEELLKKQKHLISFNLQQQKIKLSNNDDTEDGLLLVENSQRMKQLLVDELRFHFRQTDDMTTSTKKDNSNNNDDDDDFLHKRIQLGQSKLSLLRMTTNVTARKLYNEMDEGSSSDLSSRRIWIYRDGQKFEQGVDDINGLSSQQRKAMSSYDGKNLDPQSVTHHKKLLRRAGFVNNLHAKGVF